MASFARQLYGVFVVGAVALTVLSIVLLLAAALLGGMTAGMDTGDTPRNKTASPDPITGQSVSFEDTTNAREILEVYSVKDSTGYAIQLNGSADSYAKSKTSVSLADERNWSLSTWARLQTTGESQAVASLDGRVVIQYNQSTQQWVGWYYDDGSGYSYDVRVAAPNQPGNLSLVTVTANASHLTIYRNTTQGSTANISTASVAPLNTSVSNLNGTIDEMRVFADATNDSEQSDLYSSPVAPRPERNRTGRIMYDEGSGTTSAFYFTSTSVELSNADWVQGLAGNELTEGTDYELDTASGGVTALAGGRIDGAPVVWIDYRFRPLNFVGQIGETAQVALSLFSSSVIVIPAVTVLSALLGMIVWLSRYAGSSSDDRGNGR